MNAGKQYANYDFDLPYTITIPENGTLEEWQEVKHILHQALYIVTVKIQEAQPPDLGIHVSEGIGANDVFGGDRRK